MSRARAPATRGSAGRWRVTLLEPVGGEGDDPGGAADDGFPGDGAVFVVVAQVGVELVREPVLGVVREQAEDHLQAAPPGAQQCDLGVPVELVGGQLRRDRVAGLLRGVQFAAGSGDRLLGGGGSASAFLSAGGIAGSASVAARPRSAAARSFSASRTAALPSLRAGLYCDLRVRLDVCGVVADRRRCRSWRRRTRVVAPPPPRLQPAQQRGRARIEVRGQDLQDDPAVLEQGDLPGFTVVLELHVLLGPGDVQCGSCRRR